MLRISDESYERVQNAIEDIGYCCEVEDDYDQWEDIAASSMAGFLDDLDLEQLEMTVAAFEEYIIDKADDDMNMAMGVKTALARYLRERLEYLDTYVIPDVKMNLYEGEDYDDTDTAILVRAILAAQKKVDNIRIGE
jgi:hypothetical protein